MCLITPFRCKFSVTNVTLERLLPFMNCCNMPRHAMFGCKLGVANVTLKWLFAFVKSFHVISYAMLGCESAIAKVILTIEKFLLIYHLFKKSLLLNIHIRKSHLGRLRIQRVGRGFEAGGRSGGHHWAPGEPWRVTTPLGLGKDQQSLKSCELDWWRGHLYVFTKRSALERCFRAWAI